MLRSVLVLIFMVAAGCQTTPANNVQVGNSYPGGQCREIGQVIGTSGTRKNARENAMADIRHETANLSGNYVRVVAISAHSAAIRGIAYQCQ